MKALKIMPRTKIAKNDAMPTLYPVVPLYSNLLLTSICAWLIVGTVQPPKARNNRLGVSRQFHFDVVLVVVKWNFTSEF